MTQTNSVTAIIGKDTYQTKIIAGNHSLIADEPDSLGGKDQGPDAGDFLRMSLATCTAITLRMYINRKEWSVNEIRVHVSYLKEKDKTIFTRSIDVDGDVDDEQRKRLLSIANACPIHKTLTNPIEINTTLT
ncbi:MAG: OsmC family protein [Flammeovirgaceae bacterium]|nr:OsmC family protein [Flammeovirgaceae bacterium]